MLNVSKWLELTPKQQPKPKQKYLTESRQIKFIKTFKLKNYFIIAIMVMFGIIAIVSCDKTESNNSSDDVVKNASVTQRIAGPDETSIIIKRQKKWRISPKPYSEAGCKSGWGLCITGNEHPKPAGTYSGKLSNHPTEETNIVFNFTDEFIADEDELIENGLFIFDIDVFVDAEMAELIGFNDAITIQAGEYEIVNDGEGWNSVIVDIE